MLFDPARHEPLIETAWDAQRALDAIHWIVRETGRAYVAGCYWPLHPNDLEAGDDPSVPSTPLYHGAAGVVWALRYLQAVGACGATVAANVDLAQLRDDHRVWLRSFHLHDDGAYLMGLLPIELMAFADDPSAARVATLAGWIDGLATHPARELMWGSPGGLLAAAFLHERTGDGRWSDAVRRTAARLRAELHWSEAHGCHYWTQDLYGRTFTFLDGVHGFVATAHGLIRSRHLLAEDEWAFWQACIAQTVRRSASQEGGLVNWRPELIVPSGRPTKWLMQFCHGAPGFVICLAQFPGDELDDLLLAAAEAVWSAGPLTKGANLCHGTGGNAYALLAMYQRTADARWLERARTFAMHAIAQAEADAQRHGQLRHSLWTGDPGLAIFLWDCLHARARFPTLDVFFGEPSRR